MSLTQQQEMIRALEAQAWIKKGETLKDTSKPIRFKTIQKNTKLAEFVVEENKEIEEEKQQID